MNSPRQENRNAGSQRQGPGSHYARCRPQLLFVTGAAAAAICTGPTGKEPVVRKDSGSPPVLCLSTPPAHVFASS